MSDDSSASPETDLRTFLIADVRGYTRFTQDSGDEAASALTARFAGVVRNVMPGFGGELLELRGDEALCVFSSARQALRASVELQRRLREPAEGEQPFPLGVGIGLDAGEAVPTEGGYRGAALNLAARLCAIAKPGQILATERLVGLTGPVEGLHPTNFRSERLKGIPQPERLVTIEPDRPIAPPPPAPAAPAPPGQHRIALGLAAGVVIALAIVAGVVYQISQATARPAVVAVHPNSLAVIDPRVGRIVSDVKLSATPESMTAGYGKVWIGSAGQTVTAMNMSNLRTGTPLGLPIDPSWLAAGAGAVWAFDGSSTLAEIDPRQQVIVPARRIWRCTDNCDGGGLVVVGSQVWLVQNGPLEGTVGILDRIDSSTLKIVSQIPKVSIGPLGKAPDAVWATDKWEIDRIDLATDAVTRTVITKPPAHGPSYSPGTAGITASSGYTWTATGDSLYRFTSDGGTYVTFHMPANVNSIAASPNGVWVGTDTGKVLQINPFSGGVERTYPLGHTTPVALTIAAGRVWVAVA